MRIFTKLSLIKKQIDGYSHRNGLTKRVETDKIVRVENCGYMPL